MNDCLVNAREFMALLEREKELIEETEDNSEDQSLLRFRGINVEGQ